MAPRIERITDPVADPSELLALRARWAAEQGRLADPDSSEYQEFVDSYVAWLQREVHHRRFWIARVDGLAVGMVNLLLFERMPTVGGPAGGWGYLCNMYVDEAHRSNGIGALLAGDLLAFAEANGLERVVLKPTERSRPFYASLGFEPGDNLLLVRR